jgi:4-alpha-glucanotransferase
VTTAMASPALPPLTAELEAVLQHFGIAKEYIEFSGNHKQIELAARLHMLQCMGITLSTPPDVSVLWQRIQTHNSLLPPMLSRGTDAGAVPLTVGTAQLDATVTWQLQLEDGTALTGSLAIASLPRWAASTNNADIHMLALPLPVLPLGYHQLVVALAGQQAETVLVISPAQAWQPLGYADGKRWWGLACQLYTVRSDDNWGMGDFADLLHLVELAAKQGAGFVLLNPLHYLDLRYPDNSSPYSPSDRRFLNPLYLALELCPDFLAASVQAWVNTSEFQHTLKQLRAAAWVDYNGVAAAKLPLLALMYHHFQQQEQASNSERAQQFAAFCQAGGTALQHFADYQASLQIRPEAAFQHAEFHCYLQWLAQAQL